MTTLWNDIKYGLRMLRKNPGFTTVAVLTLALGIGANTAIFSLISSVILRPLPYKQPDHLVNVWGRFTGIGLVNNQNAISAPEFKDLETQNRCFTHIAAISGGKSFNLKLGDLPQRIEGAFVSPALFPLLGAQPLLGRSFLSAESQAGQDKVVLLSYGLWRRGFGADPAVVGRELNLNGVPYAVIGVMPAGFQYPDDAELWAPLGFSAKDLAPDRRADHGLTVLARVKPEMTLLQAQADLQLLSKAVEDQNLDYPYAQFEFAFGMTPLLDEMIGTVQRPLWILSGAVALVLLIACANVASLLLIRSSAREGEVAVRMALGASRGRLLRQWLTESIVLSTLGGLAGLCVAQCGLKALVPVSATILPRVADVAFDGRVLAFAMLVSLGTGVLFGLAPGLQAGRYVKADSLRGGGRSFTTGVLSRRLRHALIVAELALSLVLLSGAGLLVRSFLRVLAVDSGFRSENVLTMRVSLPQSRYADLHQVQAFYHNLQDRLCGLPGVEAAAATSALPLSGEGWSGTTTMDSGTVAPELASPEADQSVVTPGYFHAMGIALLRGRTFDLRDTAESAPVVVIDETLARTFWPGQDAVGKRLHKGGAEGNPTWATIIGVVRHVRTRTLEAPSRVQVYWPQDQQTCRSLTLVVRTKVAPLSLAATVQKEIATVDPDQPAYRIRSMDQCMRDSLAQRRLAMLLLSVLAGAALVLAGVGLYGVMAYWVGQRTHEIGVRLALGASRGDVLRLVMGQGWRLGLAGVSLGLAGALALTQVLSSMLYSVHCTDPTTFVGVSVSLIGVTLLSCSVPAWRAAKVEPMQALRCE